MHRILTVAMLAALVAAPALRADDKPGEVKSNRADATKEFADPVAPRSARDQLEAIRRMPISAGPGVEWCTATKCSVARALAAPDSRGRTTANS